jgi:hypothetical protein
MTNKITNHKEALEMALRLSVTAPTDAKAKEALEMAVGFANNLNPDDVAAIQRKLELEFEHAFNASD